MTRLALRIALAATADTLWTVGDVWLRAGNAVSALGRGLR